MCQFGQELIELLLTFIELTTADIVNAEQGHDAVDDKKAVLIPDEILGDLVQELHLVLRIDGASIGYVLLDGLGICPKTLCNLSNPLRPEGPLGVWHIVSDSNHKLAT